MIRGLATEPRKFSLNRRPDQSAICSYQSEKIQLPAYKPDSVCTIRLLGIAEAIIYLVPTLLSGSFCLPSSLPDTSAGNGRATLNGWYTWHFSMQGLPVPTVTNRNRELLPHVFTLTLVHRSDSSKMNAKAGPPSLPHKCR